MSKIVFTNRLVENPGRVKLTPVAGQPNVYDVERQEGNIIQPGTPINAETLGTLFSRWGDSMEGDLDMKNYRLKFGGSSGKIYRIGNSNQLKFEGFDVIAESLYDGYYEGKPAKVYSYRNKPRVAPLQVDGTTEMTSGKIYLATCGPNRDLFSIGYYNGRLGRDVIAFDKCSFAIIYIIGGLVTIFAHGRAYGTQGSTSYQESHSDITYGNPKVIGAANVIEIGGESVLRRLFRIAPKGGLRNG